MNSLPDVLFLLSYKEHLFERRANCSPYKQLKDNRAIMVRNNNTYAPEHEIENQLVKAPASTDKFIKHFKCVKVNGHPKQIFFKLKLNPCITSREFPPVNFN